MLFKALLSGAALLASVATVQASLSPKFHGADSAHKTEKPAVVFPANVTDYKTITTPTGITIRYKEPGKEGVCETTPGVDSYSGYIDIAPNVHMFFWFFESRRDPANDDFTVWLNGGPGSDSLIGLFQELGPCRITENLTSILNPYSWNNVSNMLFLSQPVGVGFSNQGQQQGSYGNFTGQFLNATQAKVTGIFPILDPVNVGEVPTTDIAAVGAWHVLQGFLCGMSKLQGNDAVAPRKFNLATESYGGHYGPSFFDYFYQQNEMIKNGTSKGYAMDFNSLTLINAAISEEIQAEYYPEFATKNTYNITAYNETVHNYAKFANNMLNGCQDLIKTCEAAAQELHGGSVKGRITDIAAKSPVIAALCAEAQDMCRDNVEGLYYYYADRSMYDIRHPVDDPIPPKYYEDYLNQAHIQQAVGVSVNYTSLNTDIYYQFQDAGDYIYPNFLLDLEDIIKSGVRVALVYGDADYICNWFGGQAVSLQINHKYKAEFNAAGYEPFTYGGIEYGETRERGNFSFTRIYDSGHEVPVYQPQAALALFERVISGVDIPEGLEKVTLSLVSNGTAKATHTESFVPLPSTKSAAYAAWSSSIVASYYALDLMPPPTATPTA